MQSKYPLFIILILLVLGLIFCSSVTAFLYFFSNTTARDEVDFTIRDHFNMGLEIVYHPIYLYLIQDPDKDKDGLEDEVAEAFVYNTDPKTYDSQEDGVGDGQYVYELYRSAIENEDESKLDKFEVLYRRYSDHVPSLNDKFEWRGIQTYNSYIGVSATVKDPLREAQRLRAGGKIQESIDLLEEALKEYPGNPLIIYSIGRAYHELEEYDKALSIYMDILDDPDVAGPFLYSDIASANYGLENYDLYEEYYRQSIDKFPEELEQYLTLANYLQIENRLDEAVEVLNKGLLVEPRYAAYYNLLAIIAGKQNDIDEELRLYKKAVDYDFAYAYGHFNISLIYSKEFDDHFSGYEPNLDHLRDAYVEARIAAELDPSPRHLVHLIMIYHKLGKEDEAQKLELMFKDMELDSASYNDLGLFYYENNEYSVSESYYLKAIEKNPKLKNAYNNLGNIYFSTKKYDEAIENYKKAIELDPLYRNPTHNIGSVYFSKWLNGDKTDENLYYAIEWFKKAAALTEENHQSLLSIGRSYLKLHKNGDSESLELAEKYILESIDKKYDDWLAHAELGYVYYFQGRNNDAKKEWEIAKSYGMENEEVDRLMMKL